MPKQRIIVVRGGGDLATGVVQKLARSGLRVMVLETEKPTAIRRSVALCEAVYTGSAQVEDISCQRVDTLAEAETCFAKHIVPLVVDSQAVFLPAIKPCALVDAILAKRNLGTHRGMAPITIALGPGFEAGVDVDAVIETMRGHNLGRLLLRGTALPNTGIPGEIGGESTLRVLHAPNSGIVTHKHHIGEIVQKGTTILSVGSTPMVAPFTGLLRGLIREGLTVPKGMKIADIDPRTTVDTTTISDKARCLGGAVLEAYFYLKHLKEHSCD